HLLDDVQFAQPVTALRLIGNFGQLGSVLLANAVHVSKPVVHQAELVAALSRTDAGATIMAANDDVSDFQHVNRKLHHGHTVEVSVLDDIGDVAVNEHLSRQQTDDLVGTHAAVRTAYP